MVTKKPPRAPSTRRGFSERVAVSGRLSFCGFFFFIIFSCYMSQTDKDTG